MLFPFSLFARMQSFEFFTISLHPPLPWSSWSSFYRTRVKLLSFSRASLISFLFLLRVSLRFNHRSSIIYFCASSIFSFESCDDFSQYFVSLVFFRSWWCLMNAFDESYLLFFFYRRNIRCYSLWKGCRIQIDEFSASNVLLSRFLVADNKIVAEDVYMTFYNLWYLWNVIFQYDICVWECYFRMANCIQ